MLAITVAFTASPSCNPTMNAPNFYEKLKRQLELLWASCRDFDEGNFDKALDIAVRLRVLFHTTAASTSALTHLHAEHVHLLSTALTRSTGRTFVAEGGLTVFRGKGWDAALDDAKNRRQV